MLISASVNVPKVKFNSFGLLQLGNTTFGDRSTSQINAHK